MVKNGEIPYIRIGRIGIKFRKEEIDQWLDQGSKKKSEITELLPKFDLSIDSYDKMFLKGRSVLNSKKKRWNYGIGTVYLRKTKGGKGHWYIDYRNEKGIRI